MASIRVGLPPAKRTSKASLSPALPSSSSAHPHSPSSPSTASFSPSSPRSPAYSTIPTYHNCSSKTGSSPRQLRTMKRSRGVSSSSSSSLPAVQEVLGFSPSSYNVSGGGLRFFNRSSYDPPATLLPHNRSEVCKNARLHASSSDLRLPGFLASAKQTTSHSRRTVERGSLGSSATCSTGAGCSDRRTRTGLQLSHSRFPLEEVRCRDTVFDVCFHSTRAGLLAAGLVNGGVEIHQLPTAEEVSAYLEACWERRRQERAAARRARRLKRRMQQRSSSHFTGTEQQQDSSSTSAETPLDPSRSKSNGTRTAEEQCSNRSFTGKAPPVLPNGACQRPDLQAPQQLRYRRQDTSTIYTEDSSASTTDDRRRKGRRQGIRVRLPAGGVTDPAENDNAHAEAEFATRRNATVDEHREVDDQVQGQASSSEDCSSLESSSSEGEDETFDNATWKKEVQNFETRVAVLRPHKRGCRAVRFSHDGQRLISSSSDRRLIVSNFETADASPCWRSQRQSEAINALCILTNDVVAAGDDGGCITLWDTRQPPTAEPALRLHDHEDFISDLAAATVSTDGEPQQARAASPSGSCISTGSVSPSSTTVGSQLPTHIVATGGDMLGVFDLRRKALLARSDALGEDLHCVQIVKNGSKVVCGCQDGSLSIFSWGDFGDLNDRLTGHKQSIDAMAKLEEDILLTGSSDGLIRVVQVLPNAILGILGQHKDGLATVEKLALSPDKSLLASCSYDETISIFQVAAAQGLIDGRTKRGKLPKKHSAEDVFSPLFVCCAAADNQAARGRPSER